MRHEGVKVQSNRTENSITKTDLLMRLLDMFALIQISVFIQPFKAHMYHLLENSQILRFASSVFMHIMFLALLTADM